MKDSDPYINSGIGTDASEIETCEAYREILKTLNVGGLAYTEIKAKLEAAEVQLIESESISHLSRN